MIGNSHAVISVKDEGLVRDFRVLTHPVSRLSFYCISIQYDSYSAVVLIYSKARHPPSLLLGFNMANHSNMRLGRKPAVHDPRVPHLFKHMAMQIPAPSADWTKAVSAWGMLANDRIGDCTAAGVLHQLQVWYNSNGFAYTPTDDEAVALYSTTSDYPKEDDGAVEQTVLQYWQSTGITTPFDTSHIAFASLNPKDINQIKLSVQYFGGCYLGIELPLTAQTQDVWEVVSTDGDGAPGSWGGHCVIAVAYDEQYVTVVTWGKLLKVAPAFLEAYCEESYALVSEDWLANSGISPPGLNMAGLKSELQAITA